MHPSLFISHHLLYLQKKKKLKQNKKDNKHQVPYLKIICIDFQSNIEGRKYLDINFICYFPLFIALLLSLMRKYQEKGSTHMLNVEHEFVE